MINLVLYRFGRTVCLSLLLVLGGFTAGAQSATAAVRSGYTIAGRVLNASTGAPVPRASITALDEQDRHVAAFGRTDTNGNFALANLPPGKYPLTASKRGFRTAFYDEHEDFNSAIVTGEGQDTQHLQFQLAPAAVLAGVITGDDGEGVQGASVMLFWHAESTDPTQQPPRMEMSMTDDTGAYEFGNLSAGTYSIAVKATPWFALHSEGNRTYNAAGTNLDVAYPVTYYDSTIDEASASTIELAPGSREQANISLHAVPALHLTLPQPSRPGAGPPQISQTIFGQPIQTLGAEMRIVQRGTIDVYGLSPGHYELTHGNPPRALDLDASSDATIDANAGSTLASVSGTVHDSTGALVQGAYLLLRPIGNANSRAPIPTLAESGRFNFEAVPPGQWTIWVSEPPQGTFLPTVGISSGGKAIPGDQLTVGDQPSRIDVRVSRSTVRVEGVARNGDKAAPGAMIVLVARDPSAYLPRVRRDQSDSDGSFSLRDVTPGQYTVIAIQDGWKLDWQHRESLARYLPSGVPVTVSEGTAPVRLAKPVPAVPR